MITILLTAAGVALVAVLAHEVRRNPPHAKGDEIYTRPCVDECLK